MANLYLSRDTKVYLALNDTHIWEIPVLDGYAFSQATNASEVTLAEMEDAAGNSRRGKKSFNDSLAPAEWSFTTYTRPFVSAGSGPGAADTGANVHAVEEVLWAIMAGPAYYETSTFKTGAAGTAYFTHGTGSVTIDFNNSNKSTLGEGMSVNPRLYFRVGDVDQKYYRLDEMVVDEATIDFDIDGIASINWSGMGAQLTEVAGPITPTIYESVRSTDNFIRNRLTQLTIAPNKLSNTYTTAQNAILADSYDITLTGGSITIGNNISFITPEELGIVNFPIGHVTGTRSAGGNFTCYLVADDGTTNDKSADLWADLSDPELVPVVTHDFDLTFAIGGSAGLPRVEFNFPRATIEIPTHSVEDVISLETNFTGLGTSLDTADELTISYYA